MKDFLLVFRNDFSNAGPQSSPEQMQDWMKQWQDWFGSIAAQNKLVSAGNRLARTGNVVKPNNIVTNGPYVEIKEALGGYSVVRASSLEEATEIAKGCPILQRGGNVEVRLIEGMDN